MFNKPVKAKTAYKGMQFYMEKFHGHDENEIKLFLR